MKCSGVDCTNEASKLKCPTCLKNKVEAYFCGQDCFKRSWAEHKKTHPTATHDPFPSLVYTGDLRAAYPLSPRRPIKEGVEQPDYAKDGQPRSEIRLGRSTNIIVANPEEIERIRRACKIGREVLDIAGAAVRPGITTDEIDAIVHQACMDRDAYPSPLNYYNFPKSVCTSVNEVICHGIPDRRPLEDGDIINLDVSVYKDGVHADLNETYYVGEKAKQDKDTVRLVETTRESLDKAIATVKPGTLFRSFGDVIEAHAKKNKLGVVRTYCGHGTGLYFHSPPNIPHYAKNKSIGVCKPGVVFTIEPMLTLGTYRDEMWPDNWTSVTKDGLRSAQFEHTLLVTEDGVEVLTARTESSPGGPIPRI
uniref:Methionine aminopeptidase n=1 Tax=Blastobotrys adeninivorans TaxID=409370 RepID=A0A060TBT5_BLAAD